MTMLQQFRRDQQRPQEPNPANSDGTIDPYAVEISLNAAILSVQDDQPQVLLVRAAGDALQRYDALPSGRFMPFDHGTLEQGLRYWVERQTGLPLGYAEQLYTFTETLPVIEGAPDRGPTITIGYLALARVADAQDLAGGLWRNWYLHFPWEDWRAGKPAILADEIEPRLRAIFTTMPGASRSTWDRVRLCFGLEGAKWDDERVLDRFEILQETGLAGESAGDRPAIESAAPLTCGQILRGDQRRVLAAALGRLRAKIKYRPVVFELMAREFTLFELQKTVEAILGSNLHKQNFRRLVESTGLVEPTLDVRTHTGGRPAKLFRFRREVLMERPSPGVRVKVSVSLSN